MSFAAHTAVEITKGDDHLNIWVDANNNGVRDDDDVNIFVTKSGGFYTESPAFTAKLDAHLRQKLKEASVALLEAFPSADPIAEENICAMALELVVQATRPALVEEVQIAQTEAEVHQNEVPAYWQPPTV